MPSRFSPAWHSGDASLFSRVMGVSMASPVNHEDPIHRERVSKYIRNVDYYQEAQYEAENSRALESGDFLGLRVNYTSIIRRSVNMKSDWMFAEPIGIHVIPLDENDQPREVEGDPKGLPLEVKNRVNQIRKYNESAYWDWVMGIMGLVCGDFYLLVECEADDEHPRLSLQDPLYVFPDYPDDDALPMRACQIQYNVDREGEAAEEETLATVRVTEDYRLEITGSSSPDTFEDLELIDDEDLKELVDMAEDGSADFADVRLTCVYRRFENDLLIAGSKRDIGVPVIPIVHGRNMYLWNARYGEDEVNSLIPKVEKYNEMFYYAERVARMNAHAKLFLSGVRAEENPLRADYDDVIYGGEKSSATVLSLSTDTSVLDMVTGQLEKELHRAGDIPVIAEGEAEVGYGAPSGLALLIRFGPLRSVTKRHNTTYGNALEAAYTLCLIFDEMVIDGQGYGSKWEYDKWMFQFDWTDQMPQATGEAISDGVTATGGKPIMSQRTAMERIPGVDPDLEKKRIVQESAEQSAESLEPPPPAESAMNGDQFTFPGATDQGEDALAGDF